MRRPRLREPDPRDSIGDGSVEIVNPLRASVGVPEAFRRKPPVLPPANYQEGARGDERRDKREVESASIR